MPPSNTQLQARKETANSLRVLAESPAYQARLQELLKDRAPQFITSLIQLVSGSNQLQQCDPNTVLAAGLTAAALDLPIEKNLGFAHIVPYKGQASFQLGYKGYVQLAIRSGYYKFLNACVVHKGELVSSNKLTGEITLDPTKKESDEVVGYAAYFQLTSGFEHAEYWTREEVEKHALRFSQAYSKGWETPWKTDFDPMALKTVIKDLLSHWGIMSVQLRKAISNDQTVRSSIESDDVVYVDNLEVKQPNLGPEIPVPQPVSPVRPAPQPAAETAAPPVVLTTPAAPATTAAVATEGAAGFDTEEDPFGQVETREPAEPKEMADLRTFMAANGIVEAQVLKYCQEKKVLPKDKSLAQIAALPDGKGLRKLSGILNALNTPDSTVLPEIKALKL